MSTLEAREAEWRRHLASQYAEYNEFDRGLSADFAVPTAKDGIDFAEQDGGGQKKEKKDKKDKKDKKEKKEKKDKKDKDAGVTYLPAKVTYLGPKSSEKENEEEETIPSIKDFEEYKEEPVTEVTPHEEEEQIDPEKVELEFKRLKELERCGDLRWADVVLAVRCLLLETGRLPAAEFLDRWRDFYGYSIDFPFFDLVDVRDLLKALQPGALTIAVKSGQILQASSDEAFWKEKQTLEKDPQHSETAAQYQVAGIEKELKGIRQSIKEKRMAQKMAQGQADNVRQEYEKLQKMQNSKSAQARSTKKDLDKHEERVKKFASEAEAFESQEKALTDKIQKIQGTSQKAASSGGYANASKTASGGYAKASSVPVAAKAPAAPVGSIENAKELEDLFM